jgi:MFS family permease
LSPTALITRAYASFHPDSVPTLARINYRHELTSALFFPIALAAVEGSIIGVVVKKGFGAAVPPTVLAFVVGLLVAAPEMANITSFAWAALAHGKHKIRFISALQAFVVLMVAVVALAPRTPGGLVLLTAAVVCARIAMAGVFTLRATVWGNNYERRHRARITSKFSTIQVVVIATVALVLGYMQDISRESFGVIVLVACSFGAIGVYSYSRIRLRGHRALIRTELSHRGHDRPSFNPISVLRVLKQDHRYARFMACMFVIGTGNLMLTAPLALTLADEFGQGSLGSMIIMSSLPFFVIPFAIPFWSRLLGHRHVVSFRAIHSWVFVVSQSIILLAAVTRTLELMYLGAFVQGIAFAGGALAWNLGHLDFAPPHKTAQYMGVHVTLTGIRGLFAPLVAVSIYEFLRHFRPGSEHLVFVLSVLLCIIGAIGFGKLARDMRLESRRGATL